MEQQDGISLVLARQILRLVEESGASQIEALAALSVVNSLLPTVPIPFSTASGEFQSG